MSLSVLTLNIWYNSGPWARRAELIRDWIDRLDPDLIGFQEVVRGEGIDLAEELVRDRGYHLDFVAAGPFHEHAFGNAIASRWPIVSRAELALPASGDGETRAALTVGIDSPHGELSFTTTHLNWRFDHGATRLRQVVPLYEQVSRLRPRPGFPPILIGDFNAEPSSDEIRYLTGLHEIDGRTPYLHDAWRVAGSRGEGAACAGPWGTEEAGITWSNRNVYACRELEPDRRIDYIFTGYPQRNGVGQLERCRVVCNEEVDGVWPSDHFGLVAELRTDALPGLEDRV